VSPPPRVSTRFFVEDGAYLKKGDPFAEMEVSNRIPSHEICVHTRCVHTRYVLPLPACIDVLFVEDGAHLKKGDPFAEMEVRTWIPSHEICVHTRYVFTRDVSRPSPRVSTRFFVEDGAHLKKGDPFAEMEVRKRIAASDSFKLGNRQRSSFIHGRSRRDS